MKIYTRRGDTGETGLVGGGRVSKSALRVESYGEVDELNAAIGLARSVVATEEIGTILGELQRSLFALGALLADPDRRGTSEKASLGEADVARLEAWIDRIDAQLPPLGRFILPGGSPGGAMLHLARAVCRRAERRLVALAASEPVPEASIAYLNRLSDLLFVLARHENRSQGRSEEPW